jgi:hypothetical protein
LLVFRKEGLLGGYEDEVEEGKSSEGDRECECELGRDTGEAEALEIQVGEARSKEDKGIREDEGEGIFEVEGRGMFAVEVERGLPSAG